MSHEHYAASKCVVLVLYVPSDKIDRTAAVGLLDL